MIEIRRYEQSDRSLWNDFVTHAKNMHFFFYRDYMEYHADRFVDCSLIFYDNKMKIKAIFPASLNNNILISHEGLTFGGVIVDSSMTVQMMLEIFDKLKFYCSQCRIKEIIYKRMPYIYHSYPADEDLYALFVNEAELIARNISTTILIPNKYNFFKGRKNCIKLGEKSGICVKKSEDYDAFFDLENKMLMRYHNTIAVHSSNEMKMLNWKFPENISLYTGELDGELLGGTVIFQNNEVVHTQYLLNSEKGRKIGALDYIIYLLITNTYSCKKYFDFGISTENDGRYLNAGLIFQKEGFGGRAIAYDIFRLRV